MTAVCVPKSDNSKANVNAVIKSPSFSSKSCEGSFVYKSSNACSTQLPIAKAMATIGKFLGAIYIVVGIVMAFFGTKFIFWVLGGAVGFIVAGALFLAVQVMALPIDSGMGILIGVGIACIVVGGLVAWCTAALSRKYVVQIMGAIAAMIGLVMVGRIFKQGGWVAIALGVVGAVIGWFVADKLRNFIKAAATALLGSFLLIMGIGQYAPGFPSITGVKFEDVAENPNANIELIGYAAGFVIVAVVGTIYQMKTQAQDKDDEFHEMDNEDEAKTCGCF